jgi:hypothetical protein
MMPAVRSSEIAGVDHRALNEAGSFCAALAEPENEGSEFGMPVAASARAEMKTPAPASGGSRCVRTRFEWILSFR